MQGGQNLSIISLNLYDEFYHFSCCWAVINFLRITPALDLPGTDLDRYGIGHRCIFRGWTCCNYGGSRCKLGLPSASFSFTWFAPLAVLSPTSSVLASFAFSWILLLLSRRFCRFWHDVDRLIEHSSLSFNGRDAQIELANFFFRRWGVVPCLNLVRKF